MHNITLSVNLFCYKFFYRVGGYLNLYEELICLVYLCINSIISLGNNQAFYVMKMQEHPEWEMKNGLVTFQKAKESAPCKEIPSLQLITQTLSYARELERIVWYCDRLLGAFLFSCYLSLCNCLILIQFDIIGQSSRV